METLTIQPVHRTIPDEILALIAENCVDAFGVTFIQDETYDPPMTKTSGVPKAAELATVNKNFSKGIRKGLETKFDGTVIVGSKLAYEAYTFDCEYPDCEYSCWMRKLVKKVTFVVGDWGTDNNLAAAIYKNWLCVFMRAETAVLQTNERIIAPSNTTACKAADRFLLPMRYAAAELGKGIVKNVIVRMVNASTNRMMELDAVFGRL